MFTPTEMARLDGYRRYLESKGYIYLSTGRHREAWLNKKKTRVVKIAMFERNIKENAREAEIYRNRDPNGEMQFAKCRLLKDGLLVMEYVERMPKEDKPVWADNIDCKQVGLNRKGKVVAFDYGHDIRGNILY